jgi:hypothetical protein
MMSVSRENHGRLNGTQMLRRMGFLISALLAGVVLLCAGAPAASAAPVGLYVAGEESAEEAKQPKFEAESYPATVEGQSLSSFKFTVNVGYVECGAANFFGSKYSGPTTTLTIQPAFFSCVGKDKFGGSYAISFFGNGCNFSAHVLNAGPPYTGEFGIGCPSESGYQILAKSGAITICTFTFPTQSGKKALGFKNTGTGSGRSVETSFNVSGLKYTQSGIGCEAGTFEDGGLTGTATLKAVK